MFARRAGQEFDHQSGCYMYPRSMVAMGQDCLNAIYLGDAHLTAEDGKARLTEARACGRAGRCLSARFARRP
eukprot:15460967-Alexandrium_andersonii.AAC.1